jgi:hypothetical protein
MSLWNLLTGNFNPTRSWPRNDEPLPMIRFKPFQLGKVCLGEELESIRFLGRADKYLGKFKRGNYTLTYMSRGLEVRIEYHRLVWFNFHLAGDTDWSLDGATPAVIGVDGGMQLDQTTTHDDIKRRFGEPDELDPHADQVSYIYRDGKEHVEFEFNEAGVLGAIVAMTED